MPQSSKIFYYYIFISFVLGVTFGYGFSYFFPIQKIIQTSEQILPSIKGEAVIDETKKIECSLWVEVAGAVNKPGVFCFTPGSLVNQALSEAGGLNRLAAKGYVSQRINLAKVLEGGEKIYFPFENDLKCEMVPYVPDVAIDKYVGGETKCISINSGSKKDLDSLSGIGEVTANKIIEGRPYSKIEQIKEKGIVNSKTYAAIEELICL
ncbi:MAG TPA: SLBB domain-containing protein [Candidatus Dojkabacteria bacterium]|mgnify:CR=1 FL=1|nr:SLBB domain-containing protein [Candidatus Dojkabacteria bacterium]